VRWLTWQAIFGRPYLARRGVHQHGAYGALAVVVVAGAAATRLLGQAPGAYTRPVFSST
jgi:hypothetical protein